MAKVNTTIKVELTPEEAQEALIAYIKQRYNIQATSCTFKIEAYSTSLMDRYDSHRVGTVEFTGILGDRFVSINSPQR